MSGIAPHRRCLADTLTSLRLPLVREAGMGFINRPAQLGPHRNPGYELTYLLSGEVAWEVFPGPVPGPAAVPETRQEIPPADATPLRMQLAGGDLAITQARILHQGEYRIIRPCRLLWLVVDPDRRDAARNTPFTRDDLKRLSQCFRSAGNIVVRANPMMDTAVRALQSCLEAGMSGLSVCLPDSALRGFLSQVVIAAAESLSRPVVEQDNPVVRSAIEYMQANLAEPVSVAQIAEAVGLRTSRFHEVFRSETGQTPADYFSRLRIECARDRLRHGTDPIIHIAMDLGFSSSQYFANTFRKYTGMTPSAYRKKMLDEL